MSLRLVPVTLADANGFVAMWHRHHQPTPFHKFSIGVADENEVLRGVAIVSRPTTIAYDDGQTLEVRRTATDGTKNVNSMLYGAVARATFALGYTRVITYTQDGESGASLRGAGWKVIAHRRPHSGWNRPNRPRNDKHPTGIVRTLWEASA